MDKYKAVYGLLRRIPKGKVTTYNELASKVNITPREVGRILSRNDHPQKYPCYKVVRTDGSLGGYTINGKNNEKTLSIKMKKLLRDKVKINNNKVDRSCFYLFE